MSSEVSRTGPVRSGGPRRPPANDARVARAGSSLKTWAGRVTALLAPPVAYLVAALWMFRGSTTLGMEFDEVFRINNLLPHLYRGAEPYDQAISSLTIFGHSIPLMYKEYISSAILWPYLPLPLFSDPVVGLRVLYLVITVGVASLAFWLFRRRSYWVAAVVPGLAVLSPLLYPDVTYGFVSLPHLLPLLVAVWAFARFVGRWEPWWFVLTAFLAGAAINTSFYAAFPVAGLGAAAVLLYPREVSSVVRRPMWLAASVLAALVGLFNYVYFNLTKGYPTLAPLLARLAADSSDVTIDYRQSSGVLSEIGPRLTLLVGLLGDVATWTLVLGAMSYLVLTFTAVDALRRHDLHRDRLLLVPAVALPVALLAILVSPNATRRGHYGMLVGLIEALCVAAFVALARRLGAEGRRATRALAVVLSATLAVGYAATSAGAMESVRRSGGAGFFTDAIFDVWAHLRQNGVPDQAVLQVQWGSYSQLYFLSEGTYTSPVLVFQVLAAVDDAERTRLVAEAVDQAGGAVVVPLYTDVGDVGGVDSADILRDVAVSSGGMACALAGFDDRLGEEQMRLILLATDRTGPDDLTQACPSDVAPPGDPRAGR